MLICPQCEFENSDNNKFCQNCGISLITTTCRQCGSDISLETENCGICGAENYPILWAIISFEKVEKKPTKTNALSSNVENQSITSKNLANFFPELNDPIKTFLINNTETLCLQNRYVLGEISDRQPTDCNNFARGDRTFIHGQIIDKYPRQESHLASLQKQQINLFTELKQNLNKSYLANIQNWHCLGVPTHALPYIILEKYTPTVPEIYDAWQQNDWGVVLLPDRSQYQSLKDFWSKEQLSLLQIIWFLDEMAKLWNPLCQISCGQSLLIENNLRVDEDRSFCLQQLCMDRADKPPSIKDLAKTWQGCLAKLDFDYWQDLDRLLKRVIYDEIENVEQLRHELYSLSVGQPYFNSVNTYTSEIDMNIAETNPEDSNFEQSGFFDQSVDEMFYDSDIEDQVTAIIPMQLRSVIDASYTDIGSQRNHNEDFFGVKISVHKAENTTENNLSVKGMYLVCDGMGGHAAGEVASAMAVETLQKYFDTHWQQKLPDKEIIEAGILLANKTLYQTNLNNSRSGSGRMGTTLVMALLQDTNLAIAHVGDSRIYRLTRKQGLEQLTLDHEVGQREINRGVEPDIAYGRPDAYQLTQALGPRDNNYVRPEIKFLEITEDCLLLLCSDGLSDNNLIEQHWEKYLEPLISSSSDLEEGLFRLIEFANQHNGHDNITAILVRIKLKPGF